MATFRLPCHRARGAQRSPCRHRAGRPARR